jgi:NAD(P)H-hydrate repair Nnr-like enzyme with NAD(P)H-hydrate dehydratase domain
MVVAVRGPDTWIGDTTGRRFVARHGHPALATAGSGDVLAGALAGLVARGANLLDATLWSVHAHATAGRVLAARRGIGVMARELPDELPAALEV